MRWRALLLLFVATCYAAEEEHFIDVKQIVKGRPDLPVMISPEADVSVLYQAYKSGTIEAVAKLPMSQNDTDHTSEKSPEEFYKWGLFQLPADIMTKLAADAGYIEHPQTTTSGPWIVRRKVHRSSEGEATFVQDDSEEEEEEEEEEKPRKRKKYYKKKDPTLIAISDLLPKVEKTSPMPIIPLQSAPGTTSLSDPANVRTLPVVQSATDLSHSNVQPQYAYQPIVQPDGKTFYRQVLILPGQVVASKDVLPLQPREDVSSFVQEKPRSVLQADYSVAAPTFPPPVNIFRRNPAAETYPSPSPQVRTEAVTRQSVYPSRYIRPSSSLSKLHQEIPTRIQMPQNDPIAIPSSHHQLPTKFANERQYVSQQKESLYSTKLPSGEEQRVKARVFHDEAAAPVKLTMKATQASPLRIRTIDSHIETVTAARVEELKKIMEQHQQEAELQPRKRRLRKVKKTKKLSKTGNSRSVDSAEVPSSEKRTEEFRKAIRRMPQTQFLERVPILTPTGLIKHERMHASKTWKKRRYEPVDIVVPKDLESFEDKAGIEDDVTEPPRKKRKLKKGGRAKKTRQHSRNGANDTEKDQPGSYQPDPLQEPATAAPLKRKILRLSRLKGNSEIDREESDEKISDSEQVRPKKLKRTKRVRKMKSATSQSNRDASSDVLPLRHHCLNIRTFARQFGINDVDGFSRDHCAFIENYYPHLTCDRRQEYVAECLKYY